MTSSQTIYWIWVWNWNSLVENEHGDGTPIGVAQYQEIASQYHEEGGEEDSSISANEPPEISPDIDGLLDVDEDVPEEVLTATIAILDSQTDDDAFEGWGDGRIDLSSFGALPQPTKLSTGDETLDGLDGPTVVEGVMEHRAEPLRARARQRADAPPARVLPGRPAARSRDFAGFPAGASGSLGSPSAGNGSGVVAVLVLLFCFAAPGLALFFQLSAARWREKGLISPPERPG